MKNIIFYFLGILFIIFFWVILNMVFSESIVPSPLNTGIQIFKLFLDGETIYNLGITLSRTIIGFLLALTMGSVIGIILGLYKNAEKAFFIPVILLQGAPPLLWIIPLMLILGTDGSSPIAVVFFVVMPLVIINTQEGVKAIAKDKWDMLKIYTDSGFIKVKELILPSIKSHYTSIFVLGIVLAFKSCLVGEWFGAKNGIGRIINEYFYTFNMLSFYSVSLIFLISLSIITFIIKRIVDNALKRKNTSIFKLDKNYIYNKKEYKSELLEISDLNFSYNQKAENLLLENINLTLDESIVLTGESGTGKTTFAKLAAGLIKPLSGKVNIPVRPGIIFQEDIFLDHLDCTGNVLLPLKWKKDQRAKEKAVKILELCGLKGYENYFSDELSGGMKKRLSLARAVAHNPSFIIIDEPFAQLHKDARMELWNLFFELFPLKGVPTLIITHYPEELENMDVEYYKLEDGRMIEEL